jgi:hypothetical protein
MSPSTDTPPKSVRRPASRLYVLHINETRTMVVDRETLNRIDDVARSRTQTEGHRVSRNRALNDLLLLGADVWEREHGRPHLRLVKG